MSIERISICTPLGGMPMNLRPGVASAIGVAADDRLVEDVVDFDSKVLVGGQEVSEDGDRATPCRAGA